MRTTNSNFRSDVALLSFFTVCLLTSHLANAQTKTVKFESGTWEETVQTIPNRFEIGLNISQYQKDFGIGIHVTSPFFIKKTIAIRAGTNIQWLETSKGTETTLTTYQNIQLGVRGTSVAVTQNISIYGGGGAFIILPDSDFSSQRSVFGGYGLIGFEFKIVPRFGYFIELGGVSTGATADKIAGQPVYSNGFLTNVGLKIGL